MSKENSLIRQKVWRIIDQTTMGPGFSALNSFAIDDALCTVSGKGLIPATARAWVHPPTVVLGIQDGRLPYLDEGVGFLHAQGYDAIIRNSGGLAVVLDEGVLNLSLIFNEQQGRIDINRGYDAMAGLVTEMFAGYGVNIEAREITGSYCPGSYDLSIGGRKFAGISQRRIRHGVAVQVYLCVSGSGSERAELVKEFYHRSKRQAETKFAYPEIKPGVMASLSELLQEELSIQDVMKKLLLTLHKNGESIYSSQLSEEEADLFGAYFTRIKDRNERIKPRTP